HVRSSFAALSIRPFAILWYGSLGSTTAFFMSTTVQAIVSFELTGRNGDVGLVLLGSGVAAAVLGPLGGAIADRLSKKTINIVGSSASMLVFLVTGLFIATDRLQLIHLVAGSFVNGATFAFIGPARQAWVVELVGVELRANAIALNQVAMNAARVWAPAIAGGMVAVAVIGPAGAYFTMTGLYLVALLSLAWLPPSRPNPGAERHSVLGDMVAGVRYAWLQPRLRWMLILFFLMILFGLSSTAVLPGLLENELDRDADSFGYLQAANAVGGLLASLAVASIAGSPRALTVYSVSGVLGGLALILTGVAPTFTIVLLPMLLFGAGFGAFQTLNNAVIVTESDPDYFGRITSLTFLAFAGFLVAAYPVGLAADAIGERLTLVILGALTTATVLLIAPLIARAPSIAPPALATSEQPAPASPD
ncbi:MAG: MFS transporter, partial [Dehalococcoidia bacterium]|nr:MFS transporter [Dehalococcoidia bacterium]